MLCAQNDMKKIWKRFFENLFQLNGFEQIGNIYQKHV